MTGQGPSTGVLEPAGPGPGPWSRAGGVRPASSGGFEAEMRGYLRARLRLLAATLGWVAGVTYVVNLALWGSVHGWHPGVVLDADLLAQAGLWAGAGAAWVALGRHDLSRRALSTWDALLLWGASAVCLLVYGALYTAGGGRSLGFLALLLVVRAVVVPSRAARTAWLSVVPALALLAIQVGHGAAGDSIPAPAGEPPAAAFTSGWWADAAWDQVLLGVATTTACLASHVAFRLRLEAYEARSLDQYVLEAPLGAGAMGEVYRARHALMRRPVAVKFLRGELRDARTMHRFEEEVRRTSRLTHPNTVAIYDYGVTVGGDFYYVMEMLEGADLDRIVEVTGPLPAARVIHVLAQACASLAEAHAKGLVHRDVKPSNLVLCERGLEQDVLKVMDFGLASDVRAGDPAAPEEVGVVGSPETIAPECVRGDPAGPPADLYALAAVGCHLLCGRPLFDARTVADFLAAHLERDPIPPSAWVPTVPADLERVLLRSLRKDPAERHPSAAALREDLLRCADAGRWSQADALGWWAEHGPRLRAAPPPAPSAPPPSA